MAALRRLAASLAIIFAVVTLTFVVVHLAPGTPFLPPEGRTVDPDLLARQRARFGLDQPIARQYLRYLGAVAHGDLGESFSQRRPVADAIVDALPNTLLLGGLALVLDFVLGVALGVFQATRARRPIDAALSQATLFLYSVPTFWLGLVLLLVFGERWHWFPVGGASDPVLYASLSWAGRLGDRAWHLALPTLTLALVGAAGTARFQRAALLEALGQDFVRAARARGLPERTVVLRHALRNALLPTLTLLGVALPFLLTGDVLIETIFAYPGIGKLATDALFARDYPLVTAATLIAVTLVVSGSGIADLLYRVVDPRVRARGEVAV